jgi:hypothetical protein
MARDSKWEMALVRLKKKERVVGSGAGADCNGLAEGAGLLLWNRALEEQFTTVNQFLVISGCSKVFEERRQD